MTVIDRRSNERPTAARRWLAAGVLWLVPLAGPARADDRLSPAPDPSAIIGGVPTIEGELEAVVRLSSDAGTCSGTVIAPRVVLTAAHCLDDLSEDAPVTVTSGPDGDQRPVVAEHFDVHPQYCPTCQELAYDFAYVLLPDDYLPPDQVLLPLTSPVEWDEAMRLDNVILLAGYGTDDPYGANTGGSHKRKVTVTIGDISDNGHEFFAGGNQRDTCSGDSGGAAVVELIRGVRRLVGVTSRGSNPCGDGGWYGVPYAALPWVQVHTGVQLLPPGCQWGGCLDLAPGAGEDVGCRVGRPSPSLASTWWLLVLLASRRRHSQLPLERDGSSPGPAGNDFQ